MSLDSTRKMIERLIGVNPGLEVVSFNECGQTFDCVLPKDSLWTALKDNVLLREYERAGVSLAQVSGTVIDAGAHVGIFALLASPHATQIVCLEPNASNFQLLEFNLMRNLAASEHVQYDTRKAALWGTTGQVMFDDDYQSIGGRVSDKSAGTSVPAVTMAEVVETWGRIGLLKLDIEGAEFPVLASTPTNILREIEIIVVELHLEANPEGHLQIEQKLVDAGFEVSFMRTPIHYWRDSLGRLLSNWSCLQGHWRLKTTAAGIISLFPLVNRLIDLDGRMNGHLPSCMYAHQP